MADDSKPPDKTPNRSILFLIRQTDAGPVFETTLGSHDALALLGMVTEELRVRAVVERMRGERRVQEVPPGTRLKRPGSG